MYRQNYVTDEILKFFSEEKGLCVTQLMNLAEYKRNDFCRTITQFGNDAYNLIRFYRDTPGLCVDDLLNYDWHALINLLVFDKNQRLIKWILANELIIPKALFTSCNSQRLSSLSRDSGIEYLNRVFFHLSKIQHQAKLNDIASMDSCALEREIESTLKDTLVPLDWCVIETRFHSFNIVRHLRDLGIFRCLGNYVAQYVGEDFDRLETEEVIFHGNKKELEEVFDQQRVVRSEASRVKGV